MWKWKTINFVLLTVVIKSYLFHVVSIIFNFDISVHRRSVQKKSPITLQVTDRSKSVLRGSLGVVSTASGAKTSTMKLPLPVLEPAPSQPASVLDRHHCVLYIRASLSELFRTESRSRMGLCSSTISRWKTRPFMQFSSRGFLSPSWGNIKGKVCKIRSFCSY